MFGFKTRQISIFVCLLIFINVSSAAMEERYLCVFDPIGRNGDIYTTAKDIVVDYLEDGYNFKLYPYTTEAAAKADFKSGLCDAVVHTGFEAREYNTFASSIEAIGGVLDYQSLKDILFTIMQPRAAPLFDSGEYEIAGIYPAGGIYIHIADRKLKKVGNFEGSRMFVFRDDPISETAAQILGATGVKGDTTNFASLLKRDRVDVTMSPIAVTEALELDKAIKEKGGIVRFPLFFLTLHVIIRKESFPPGFAQTARTKSLDHFDRSLNLSLNAEAKIDENLWIDLNPEELDEWESAQEFIRLELSEKSYYDKRMLKILKKVRCKNHPERFECQS